jgi:hypothetical protein
MPTMGRRRLWTRRYLDAGPSTPFPLPWASRRLSTSCPFERSPAEPNGLSYAGFRNAPGRTRTSDTRFRKPLLNVLGKGTAGRVRLPSGSRPSATRALSGGWQTAASAETGELVPNSRLTTCAATAVPTHARATRKVLGGGAAFGIRFVAPIQAIFDVGQSRRGSDPRCAPAADRDRSSSVPTA